MRSLVSIIIPYYQSQPGVLSRALRSIDAQILPEGWELEVIVVDDGSPVSARGEVVNFNRSLRIIKQPNAGVSTARNTGLDYASPDAKYIAFLDSDDAWPADHLSKAIASEADIYFSDSERPGFHESNMMLCEETSLYLKTLKPNGNYIEIPAEKMIGAVITEFPCQASTVVCRADLTKDVRFDVTLKSSGEDVLYFAELASLSKKITHDTSSKILCGEGENIYFGGFDWDSPNVLTIKMNHVLAHRKLGKKSFIKGENRKLNDARLRAAYVDLGFHLIRNLVKAPGKAIKMLIAMLSADIGAVARVVMAIPTAMTRSKT